MLKIQVFCVLLFVIISVECGKNSRQNGGLKKEANRFGKRHVRSEAFDSLFNMYDPTFLAVVWPKITNGVHILVDHTCWEELAYFFNELSAGRVWAYNGGVGGSPTAEETKIRKKGDFLVINQTFFPIPAIYEILYLSALDASGRYGSGLFTGNRFWLGSKEECLRLDKESLPTNRSRGLGDVTQMSRRKYFDSDLLEWRWMVQDDDVGASHIVDDHRPPYRLAYTSVKITLNITKFNMLKSSDVTLGVCMPRSCSPRDITSVINFSIMINDNLKANKTSRSARIVSVRRIDAHYDIVSDNSAILLISITAFLAVLVIVATVIDLELIKCLPYGKKSMTFDLEKYNTDPHRRVVTEDLKSETELKTEAEKLGVEHANLNYLAVEKMMRGGAPTITLDVNCAEKMAMRKDGSCNRCGKYKKQCSNPRQVENLPPCPRLKYNSFASLSTESKKKNIFCKLLLCFSFAYCWKRIFNKNTANKDLSLIHVMRVLATFWIMLIHVAIIVGYISDDAGDINEHNNIYFIIATGTIAFDTLFFVSGLFSSHHFFFLKSQYSVKELVGLGGACGQVLQFVCFVTNRVIRLLPSYAYVVLVSAVLARWSRRTAALALPDDDERNCRDHAWRNLLYITNLYPTEEQCMQISWYMSTETQLHMLGALLCAASASSGLRARLCAALATLAMLASTTADASAAYFEVGQLYSNSFGAYATIIERPLARVAPYFIGVFTGWIIHIMQGKFKVSKVTSSLLWMASLSFMLTSSAVPLVGLPWLAAWLHLTWPIALLWPVIIGTTNLAGVCRSLLARSSVAALSRLCYGMLLLHTSIARTVLLSIDSALCSHTICVWLYFSGTAILTLLASLLLSLLVEMPCCSLLRRLSDCAS